MSEVHAHDEERRFFSLEMNAKSHYESSSSRKLTWAYDKFSHFGWSILRPLYALVLTYVLSLIGYFALLKNDYAPSFAKIGFFLSTLENPVNWTAAKQLLAFTAAGSIPLFGHKDLAESFTSHLFDVGMHFWIYVISVFQSISSATCIFLMLLAVRNRYRIK